MLNRLTGIALLALLSAAGCTVVVRGDPPPRTYVVQQAPPPPPPPQPAVQVVWEEEEVHTVVYREYFGASDAEIVLIPHYKRYYYWTDDDIYFLWFVSRRANVSFEVCCGTYYRSCGGDYNRLIVSYNVPRASFFVSVNVGTYPPIYARTYACYQSNTYNVTFTHEEFHALVSMKVGCEYQGHAPTTFMAKVQAGTPPNRVVIQSKESCGKGGMTATGGRVQQTAPHPWTLPPAQHQQWQKDHQSQVAKSEGGFKEQHKEQVQKVQQKEKEQAHDKARDDKSRDPKAAGQPGGQTKEAHEKERDKERDDKARTGGAPPKEKDKDERRPQPGEKPPPPKHEEKPPPKSEEKKPPPKGEEKKEEKKEK